MKKIFLFLAAALVSSSSFGQVKRSVTKNQNTTGPYPFPQSTGFSVDYLRANFWRLSYTSAGPALAYRIVLPKTMKASNVKPTPVNHVGITLIGEYQVTDPSTPYLEVQVSFEKVSGSHSTLKSWFAGKLAQLKGTLQKESVINISGKEGYDALFTRTIKKSGEQYLSRASILNVGNYYIMVTAMSSKADYDRSAKTIYHILSNWTIQ